MVFLWVKKGIIVFFKEVVILVIMVGLGNDKIFLFLLYVGVGNINYIKE